MDEEDRLQRLVAEITSNDGYLTGRRRFPRTVTADDADKIVGLLHAEIDRQGRERTIAIERRGLHLACKPGCNACCEHPVLVFAPEAIRVARWLERPENAAAKAAFIAAFPAWRERSGEGIDQLADLTARQADRKEIEAAHIEIWKRRALCAFNHDGACVIYAVRPALCRDCHALETEVHCRADDDAHAELKTFNFVPLAQMLTATRRVAVGVHNALGGRTRRPESLCGAVHALLSK